MNWEKDRWDEKDVYIYIYLVLWSLRWETDSQQDQLILNLRYLNFIYIYIYIYIYIHLYMSVCVCVCVCVCVYLNSVGEVQTTATGSPNHWECPSQKRCHEYDIKLRSLVRFRFWCSAMTLRSGQFWPGIELPFRVSLWTGHPAGPLRVNLVTATKCENVCRVVNSTTLCLTFLRGEIISQPNQLSTHVVNFSSERLDSVFTPKAEITGLVDHTIIIKNKK